MAKHVKKHKFNAVDAILIIMILAIIGAAVFLFVIPKAFPKEENKPKTKDVNIRYEIRFTEIEAELKDVLLSKWGKDDPLFDAMSEFRLGKVVNVKAEPTLYGGVDASETGDAGEVKVKNLPHPDKWDIIMVVEAKATLKDKKLDSGRYSIDGGYDISVGSAVRAKLPYFSELGYCVKLGEIKNDAKGAK